MPKLATNAVCDQCGKYRYIGNHQKCSKARQMLAKQGKLDELKQRSLK